ncbi:hypothetical protein C9F11_31190 [Streptomyces sp. YIM 121038]|uniref:protein phosphatase 2C domain-containing protein n=1 Tax=Streptomyces sp. YIM 121038 TaxID=2136401 RepID=UPI00111017AC|nr:protein phosphatase 2C domain-containing protein [Streptomyces sp. YIM 121038]QCX79829.1 hypothetical protein C9F11_31190 [Streptomyces sp. YIM 121038]
MSQQGERPTGQEADWWAQLYDEAKDDTGPAAAGDSLDDRFASAAGTVGEEADDGPPAASAPTLRGTFAARPTAGSRGGPFAPAAGEPPPRDPTAYAAGSAPRVGPADDDAPTPPPAPARPPDAGGGAKPYDVPGQREAPAGVSRGEPWGEPRGESPREPQGEPRREPLREPPREPRGEPLREPRGEPLREPRGEPRPKPQAPSPGPPPPPPATEPGAEPGTPGASPPAATPPPAPAWPPGVEPPRGPVTPPARTPAPRRPPSAAPPPTEPRTDRRTDRRTEPHTDRRTDPPAAPPPTDPPTDRRADRRTDPTAPPTYRAPAPWAPATPSGPVTFPSAPERPAAPPTRPSTESSAATAAASHPPKAPADPEGQGAVGEAPALPARAYVGDGPPTYEAEPTGLPAADPDDLGSLVADTVLDGARYGASTLRAASVRGDSARYRAEPRRDALLTARFGAGEDALVLVAMATGARATAGAHRAAADACAWIGRAVGRSHARLAQDIKAARRGDLKSGLHRLTDRSLGKLRARAADLGLEPEEYTASLRCLLLPADPRCRTRVFFGVGSGGLFRLRGGEWQDIEPRVATTTGAAVVGFGSPPAETPEGDRLTMDLGITTPPSPYEPAPAPPRDPFRFRASVARPGDTLLLCTGGLAEPLRGEPELSRHLTRRWAEGGPPGLAAFLADTQVRVKGYADDRTAAAVWEA